MIGYQNPNLGYVLWVVSALLLLVAAWPWLKRWRPLTFVSEQGALASGTDKPTSPPADSEEVQRLKRQLAEAQQTIRSQRKAMEDEQGIVHWGESPGGVNLTEQIAEDRVREQTGRLEEELRETKQERDELKQENEKLIAEVENRPGTLPDTFEEWMDSTPLHTVQNRTFRNDRVELDGCHYANCVFDSCTFSFKGTKPFRVAETCRIEGGYAIDPRAPQALAIIVFLKSLGALPPDTEYLDPHDGGPVD